MKKKNIGSDFNDILRDEGIYDEVHAAALKEVFAAELRGAMKSAGLTEQALAARMGSKGRNTVRRLLDPKNKSATLMVMVQAAHAAGLEMGLSFKKARNTRTGPSFAHTRGNVGPGDPMTISAAGQVMTNPRMVEVLEQLRPLAREADMTDAKLHALVRTTWRSGGSARGAAGASEARATVTRDMAPKLARRLGVDEIEIAGVAGEVGVHHTLRGGRVIAVKVVIGPSATVGDVLVHRDAVRMLKKMSERDAAFTAAHEAAAEVRKYEAMVAGRMAAMIVQLHRGDAAAASRIENEILVMAGELSHWRGVLAEMNRTGDRKRARGLIEARDIGKVTAEAIAASYPELSNGYHYRRWPGRGPEDQEFQVFRADANSPEPPVQLRRRGNDWILEEIEGSGKVPRAFEATLPDAQVLAIMRVESQSLRAYVRALTELIGLLVPAVQARMRHVIERMRTPPHATPAEVAAGARHRIDEHTVLHALKSEFYEEFFACAAREPTPEEQLARFIAITRDLNTVDLGNLREDFLARRDPGSVQHVKVKHTDHPHLGLSARERHIDRVSDDGTAVEVKSITGKLSPEELAQLEDYKRMVGKTTVQVAGKPMRLERAMYEFTDPAGVLANLKIIGEQMLGQGVWMKVYNQRGQARILRKVEDLVGIEEWLAHWERPVQRLFGGTEKPAPMASAARRPASSGCALRRFHARARRATPTNKGGRSRFGGGTSP